MQSEQNADLACMLREPRVQKRPFLPDDVAACGDRQDNFIVIDLPVKRS